jgi:catechol 2,3-dioxygenase-like lactoylglutathione lyase family enzyme
VRIGYVSVMVDDQERALRFYADVLGFRKAADVPTGEHRWLAVTSPAGPEGVELLLEPLAFPPLGSIRRPCSMPVSRPSPSSPVTSGVTTSA